MNILSKVDENLFFSEHTPSSHDQNGGQRVVASLWKGLTLGSGLK